MAHIAITGQSGDAAPVALRLARHGHDVTFHPQDPECLRMLAGLVPVRRMLPAHPDLLLVDSLECRPLADAARRRDVAVIGGNALETWESDRALGLRMMADLGLGVSRTERFTSLATAVRFLEAEGGDWYFKPDGDVPKSMTRKGDAAWLLRFLAWAKPQLRKATSFVLQVPAPTGIEIDVGAWLDGDSVVACEIAIEEKKFLTGNHGPALGCASNVVWEIPLRSKLMDLTLAPFLDPLLATGYCGIASINTIITPTLDVYGLEFTMRCGWDSTQAGFALFDDTLGDQLVDLANRQLAHFARRREAGMTLRLSLPPVPVDHADHDTLAGMPLPAKLLDEPALWLEDVAQSPGGPVLASGSGYLGCAVTTGTDIEAMRTRLVACADGLDIADLMYRTDPVSRLGPAVKFLREHKLAPDPFTGRVSAAEAA